MKKVLIVITDMGIGGAQRSLLSFLKCLTDSELKAQYELHLMVVDPKGGFYNQIPEDVHQLTAPKALHWLGTAFSKELLTKQFSVKCLWTEIKWLLKKALKRFPAKWNVQQRLWSCWKNVVPALPGHYDVAISYIDGYPNYYVMEKVSADKKVLWVHSVYQKLQYDESYDEPFYEKANSVITISPKCRQCILQAFPQLEQKVYVLENISASKEVLEKSQLEDCPEFADYPGLKLLSVGRLNAQKGYDLAIESARILKEEGISFKWLILGEGPERESLQQQIESCGVSDCFYLLGNRSNPYSYMAKCDLLVQPSRVEGKSVVLDEAKILCKPVVVTDYTTVRDSVEHGKSGWITAMEPQAIADGIRELYCNAPRRNSITEYLNSLPKGNESELQKYIQYMF